MMNAEQQPKPMILERTYPAVREVLQELEKREVHTEDSLLHFTFLTQENQPLPVDLLVRDPKDLEKQVSRLAYQQHEQGMTIHLKDADGNLSVVVAYDRVTRKIKTRGAKTCSCSSPCAHAGSPATTEGCRGTATSSRPGIHHDLFRFRQIGHQSRSDQQPEQ